MVKGRKSDVQFILPDPEPQFDDDQLAVDEYLETPYTSILMSTASGDGCAKANILQPANAAFDSIR